MIPHEQVRAATSPGSPPFIFSLVSADPFADRERVRGTADSPALAPDPKPSWDVSATTQISPALAALLVSEYLFTVEAKKTDRRGCPPGAGTQVAPPFAHAPDTPNRGRIGNPPHVPTPEMRERVRTYAKVMNQQMIAASFEPPISTDTLQRHYRAELDAGLREAVAAVGARVLAKAMNGNLTAAIFFLRTQGGWTAKHELGGPGGAPLKVIDLTAFLADKDEDECRAIEQVLTALATAGGIDVPGVLGVGDRASQDAEAEPRT